MSYPYRLTSTRAQAAAVAVLLAAMALAVGCNNQQTVRTDANYRTIQASPLQDTDAAKRLNQQGLAHLADGELEKAENTFKAAITEDIEYGPAHNNLGKVYYLQGDYYQAALEYDYARRQMPTHAGPRYNLGLIYERAAKQDAPIVNLNRAIEYYREAVALAPGNITYRAALAHALVERGDKTDELRDLLEQILEKDRRPDWITWARRQRAALGDD